jgi:hypothetical protein
VRFGEFLVDAVRCAKLDRFVVGHHGSGTAVFADEVSARSRAAEGSHDTAVQDRH